MIAHGTYGGYQRCRLTPEGPCDECRAACAAYVHGYREVVGMADEMKRRKARRRALSLLARLYQAEYRRLLRQELARDPIEPHPRRPRGTVAS